MIRAVLLSILCATPAVAQNQAAAAVGGVLRVLDKTTGIVQDVELRNGEDRQFGFLNVQLGECRYLTANPSGDAFELLRISYRDELVFEGWMIASAPAISALQHPRYDVWALRCIRE